MKRFVCISFALCLAVTRIAALPAIKITVPAGAEAYIPLVSAIYAKMGYTVVISVFPAERAIQAVNSGDYDATLGVAGGQLSAFPNLMYTKEALVPTSVQAWVAKGSGIEISGPADLRNRKLGLVRGGKLVEAYVANQGLAVESLNDFGLLERMLRFGRVEVALVSSAAVPASFPTAFTLAASNIFSSDAYHVLNKKNAALAPKIDAIIRKMKADGSLERYLSGK